MRITLPRVLGTLSTALLVTYAFVIAPRISGAGVTDAQSGDAFPGTPPTVAPAWVAQQQATAQQAAPAQFPPAGGMFTGVMTKQGAYDLSPVDQFDVAVHHQPDVLEFSVGWWDQRFDRRVFDTVAQRGMMPMVAWEPWDFHKESKVDKLRGDQPQYALKNIIGGSFDGYVKTWAQGVKSLGYPVALRFAHEMNGYWYPWAEQANGNQKGQYVQAWRHVHDIFAQAGVTNVTWVWSPNIDYDGSADLAALYPGDDYVDWVGMSGYYGTVGMEKYQSFDDIFDHTIKDIRSFTQKPLVVTETGATDTSGLKAHWITELFQQLAAHPDIIGLIWYESVKEVDWRISVSPAASAAFAQGVSAPRYTMHWGVDSVPLRSLAPPSPGPSPTPAASPSPSLSPTPDPGRKHTPTPTRTRGATSTPKPTP